MKQKSLHIKQQQQKSPRIALKKKKKRKTMPKKYKINKKGA